MAQGALSICRRAIRLPVEPRAHVATASSQPGEVMKFLSMVRINEKAGVQVTQKLMEDMGRLMEELTRAGKLVSTAGLRPTAEGVRVRQRNGKQSMTEGPFVETKEVIGGFAILEARDLAEAIELTRRFLRVHGDEWDVECEVRQMEGPEFEKGR
jgi:hypothetical protein